MFRCSKAVNVCFTVFYLKPKESQFHYNYIINANADVRKPAVSVSENEVYRDYLTEKFHYR